MKIIKLTKNMVTLVDDEDYKILTEFKWCAMQSRKNFYAHNYELGRMHTFLMPVKKPYEVDHIDRNTLNNQKSNLRICTHQQNNWNQGKKKAGTSKYKGVYWFPKRNKWIARMRIKGITTHLGCFDDETAAARCYDEHAIIHFGEFAYLNLEGATP